MMGFEYIGAHHIPSTNNKMPPRKKAKPNVPAVETPVADEDAMAVDTPTAEDEEPAYDMLKDPWTDEQESSLFKGLMKWKPNGQ